MKQPQAKGKFVGRFRFTDKGVSLVQTKDCFGNPAETGDAGLAEWELVEELPADQYTLEAGENGWLVYRRVAESAQVEDGATLTHDAAQPGKLAAFNTRMREFWSRRTAEGKFQ